MTSQASRALLGSAALLTTTLSLSLPSPAVAQTGCITANVVVLDQPLMFNRLGAQNVNGILYALERDVVDRPGSSGGKMLRPDKRPRPLVLRVPAGRCLQVTLKNRLAGAANPFSPQLVDANFTFELDKDDQVAERWAGFHPQGLELVGSIASDSSHVGTNASSLVAPGGDMTYTFHAPKEGAFLVTSPAASFGGEGSAGNVGNGMFAVVNVEPPGAQFYRSQVTEEELRLASLDADGVPRKTSTGHPIVDYEARYPNTEPWITEKKNGRPILNMLDGNEIVHSDLNAIITGPGRGSFSTSAYPLESVGKRNPSLPNRLESFREFTVVFHDEASAAQAFPGYFEHPVLKHTLHGVRDGFMVNYGSGGVGAEVIANRLGVGPMHDCLDCAYEEFFLTSFAVGDPAMLVDMPANMGLEAAAPGATPGPFATGPKATKAFYPDDPSNVHHAYMNDFVKFRNLHAGKEQHVFHLHNHQWLFNPNDDNSNYIDAQGVGPGSGYTYEINFGGAGNRNKTTGDAIFHCHFYPHFAQGMWEHFRVHDVFEAGTPLAASFPAGGGLFSETSSFHAAPFALRDGTPAIKELDGDSVPVKRMRALPDGEIVAGTPIPAVVPLPGKPMAPMPGDVYVVQNPSSAVASQFHGETPSNPATLEAVWVPVGSNAHVDPSGLAALKNPGYPFWIAGIEHTVGQRPTTPPLDMLSEAQAALLGADAAKPEDPLNLFKGRSQELVASAGGFDGGLPRHTLDGKAAGGEAISHVSRLDMTKFVTKAKPVYFPEEGTYAEQVAMKFHATPLHQTCLPDGTCAADVKFVTNGLPPMPSAPYNEPCRDDLGARADKGAQLSFFGGQSLTSIVPATHPVEYGAANPRTYKAANIQIDAVLNKVGYHYPQQRITALWDDVLPTINKLRPPEPFVIRFNTYDCGKYLHSNLVPSVFELDDYQVRTPTDIIGQHIHLPKWDLTSADGSANGWNYEDGTLSPGGVRERIEAINEYNETAPEPVATLDGATTLHPLPHPYAPLGSGFGDEWLGARVTIQRWFFDPVVNVQGRHRGLGIIFTHDHYGPSTHQQIGLYASVLTEPPGSSWVHNETGVALGSRPTDGGPTSWQAAIQVYDDLDGNGLSDDSHREFWFQATDFQHAYEAGVYVGADDRGRPLVGDGFHGETTASTGNVPSAQSYRYAIAPSVRNAANPTFPDLIALPPICPGGVARPCPEAISAEDPGMFVLNYRQEPVALRVYDPSTKGQASGDRGDLAFALQTRTDRAIPALNTRYGDTPYPPLTSDVGEGDPFTPLMRAYAGDKVRLKVQVGGQEEELHTALHGMKWLQGGSGFGSAPNSGWRTTQAQGISEQFAMAMPLTPFIGQAGVTADYVYSATPSQDGWWSGAWGLIRTYNAPRADLVKLPNGGVDIPVRVGNARDWIVDTAGACPRSAPLRQYDVTAVLANDVLPNPGVTIVPPGLQPGDHAGGPLSGTGTLVYNPRTTSTSHGKSGPLHDPTAMLYVRTDDLEARNPNQNHDDPAAEPGCFKFDETTLTWLFDKKLATCPNALKAGVSTEPIVLRAAAGDCIEVILRNRLPGDLDGDGAFDPVPDLPSYTLLMGVVNRDVSEDGAVTTFNNNRIRPSSWVGLHPQLVSYDVTRADGTSAGKNPPQLAPPGGLVRYRWYAGDVSIAGTPSRPTLLAKPIEFGGTGLIPADKVKQGQKALVGALVVHPQGSSWTEDAGRRSAATVTAGGKQYRDFTLTFQKQMSHRYADGSPVENIGAEGEVADDVQDAGQLAINNRTEPMWFRFGLPANAPLGNHGPGTLGAVGNAREAYSNALVGGDPVTPVFTATKGQEIRMHLLEPHGGFRGSTFNLHGHVWQRDPYTCPGENDLGLTGKCKAVRLAADTTLGAPSNTIGDNPIGWYLGGQESIQPYTHFELRLPSAGGAAQITGDYLFRDQAGFGNLGGLWGILRVTEPQATTVAPPATNPPGKKRK